MSVNSNLSNPSSNVSLLFASIYTFQFLRDVSFISLTELKLISSHTLPDIEPYSGSGVGIGSGVGSGSGVGVGSGVAPALE